MSNLLNIYLDPSKVFADLKDKPSFWMPLLLVIAVNVLLMLAYHLSVDPDWFIDHALAMTGKEMSAAEVEQAKQFMPGARMSGYIGAGMMPVVMPIMFALFSLYYLLAGKITGAGIGFKHCFTLVCWSSMPVVLSTLVALVGVALMEPQTGIESLKLTNIDPLLVQLPFDHAFSSLAKNFDLLGLWGIFLLALGWKTFGRTGWTQAVIVAALPTVVIYGIWALIAAL
ncbi:MAG TPA: YIP1 family protein [Arenimonas sp.]|nr:YIP1 family protein [Arenimonas sp.]